MLFVVKNVMRLCAVMIGVCIGIGLHGLMPNVGIVRALLCFLAMGMGFLFACTLVVASLLIGSAPGRSKLGQKLSAKVDSQHPEAKQLYERLKAAKQSGATATKKATVPGKDADSQGSA